MKKHLVVALAYDQLCTFEFGCVVEMFAREIVEEEATTLRRLVQEFSDFARLPDVHVDPADLAAFCRDYVEAARDVAAVADVTVEAPDVVVPTSLDRALFRRWSGCLPTGSGISR